MQTSVSLTSLWADLNLATPAKQGQKRAFFKAMPII